MNPVKSLFTILFCLITIASFAQQQIPNQGLIAYYPFNYGQAEDASSNDNDGELIDGVSPARDRFGNNCSAMRFDGTGYISVPTSHSLESPKRELTLSVWFQLDRGSEYKGLQWVTALCKSDYSNETGSSPQYRLQATEYTVSLNTDFTEEIQQKWRYNKWYHYVLTYDGMTVKAFQNGQMIFEYYYSKKMDTSRRPLEIGRDLPGALEYFTGVLDDIRIYNRALNEREIQRLYKDETERDKPGDPCASPSIPSTQPPLTQLNRPRPEQEPSTSSNTPAMTDAPGYTVPNNPTPLNPQNDPAQSTDNSDDYPEVFINTSPQNNAPSTTPQASDNNQPSANSPSTSNIPNPNQGNNAPSNSIDRPPITSNGIPPSNDANTNTGNNAPVYTPPSNPNVYEGSEALNTAKLEKVIIGGDTVVFQQTVIVNSPDVYLYAYDHQKIDGDIVSININGYWVVEQLKLDAKRPSLKRHKLTLMPNVDNYLISKAWNVGRIPPNTLTVEIDDRVNPPVRVPIESEIGKSGAIKIIYQPQ
ncbi:MAG: LamG-like jellyroll fold domain-containing protein [Bacteroidota bacterium]